MYCKIHKYRYNIASSKGVKQCSKQLEHENKFRCTRCIRKSHEHEIEWKVWRKTRGVEKREESFSLRKKWKARRGEKQKKYVYEIKRRFMKVSYISVLWGRDNFPFLQAYSI